VRGVDVLLRHRPQYPARKPFLMPEEGLEPPTRGL
jgi:hypothetical protein